MAMETNDASPSRPPPLWVSIPIILLCLVGGGWVVHLYVKTSPLVHDRSVLGDPPTVASTVRQAIANGARNFTGGGNRPGNRGGGGGGGAGNPPPQLTNGNVYDLRTAKVHVRFWNGRNGQPLSFQQAFYTGNDVIPRDVSNTDYLLGELSGNNADRDKLIAAMGLTPAQINRLRGVPRAATMVVADADRNQLTADYVAWRDATARERSATTDKATFATATTAALKKLDETADGVGDRSIEPTTKAYAAQAAAINAIVTPDQWDKYKAFGGGR